MEVSAERLRANAAAIREVAGAEAETLAVIKADAYGHGAELVAPVLVGAGVRWLGVADLEEGVRVRRAIAAAESVGIESFAEFLALDPKKIQSITVRPPSLLAVRILVMSGMEPDDAPGIVEQRLTPVVWTVEHIDALEMAASAVGQRVAVHLEIDTGMARQGVRPGARLAAVLERLRAAVWVRCEGAFSHLSSSEVRESVETLEQTGRFSEALAQMAEGEVIPEWIHLANTSAIAEGCTAMWVRKQAAVMSAGVMVRPGIALYGYQLPLSGLDRDGKLGGQLQPVATWKTRVIGVREIGAGDTVGYGATFLASAPMRLALLPVGYSDGFRREASSGAGDGWVMIAGERAAVVGRVSMNLTVVDVTAIAGVGVGDEVVLLGEGVSAEDHAEWCGTISYEILCGIRAERRLV